MHSLIDINRLNAIILCTVYTSCCCLRKLLTQFQLTFNIFKCVSLLHRVFAFNLFTSNLPIQSVWFIYFYYSCYEIIFVCLLLLLRTWLNILWACLYYWYCDDYCWSFNWHRTFYDAIVNIIDEAIINNQ